jgi:zinc/manganese transport system substrate-binding protein
MPVIVYRGAGQGYARHGALMTCIWTIALLTGALLLPVFQSTSAAKSGGLRVVATFSILGDLVRNVGGDNIELRTLVGPDGDVHTFEPTPADSVALANASLLFENGLEFEPWLDKLFVSSGSKATRMVVTNGLERLITTATNRTDAPAHRHGEIDPHVWQDPINTLHIVQAIRDALAQADPANARTYRANAERYTAEL